MIPGINEMIHSIALHLTKNPAMTDGHLKNIINQTITKLAI
jgi:hypothetical protein